jgi:hypothetical protein
LQAVTGVKLEQPSKADNVDVDPAYERGRLSRLEEPGAGTRQRITVSTSRATGVVSTDGPSGRRRGLASGKHETGLWSVPRNPGNAGGDDTGPGGADRCEIGAGTHLGAELEPNAYAYRPQKSAQGCVNHSSYGILSPPFPTNYPSHPPLTENATPKLKSVHPCYPNEKRVRPCQRRNITRPQPKPAAVYPPERRHRRHPRSVPQGHRPGERIPRTVSRDAGCLYSAVQPEGPAEFDLIEEMVAANGASDAYGPSKQTSTKMKYKPKRQPWQNPSSHSLTRHESRLERADHRALKTLLQLQHLRKTTQTKNMQERTQTPNHHPAPPTRNEKRETRNAHPQPHQPETRNQKPETGPTLDVTSPNSLA